MTSRPPGAVSRAQPGPFRALRHRNFRLFFVGQGISMIGTWMQTAAQAWLVLELTDSPLRLGVVNALQFTPVLLLGLVGGAAADRFPKRRLLLITQTVLMTLAFILAALAWTGTVRFWHVALLATLLGLTNSVEMPARQSFFVEMVEREDLMNAIALNSTIVTAGRMVGPAVAGVVIARFGVAPAFLLNGVSFLAVLGALALMRTAPAEPAPPQRLLAHIGEGLRYIGRTPAILTALAILGAISAVVLNFNVLIPVLARTVLRGDAETYGLLMSASGAGALAGALGVAATSRRGPRRPVIFAAAAAVSLAVLWLGFARSFPVAAALAFAGGFSMITFIATTNSHVQVLVPDGLRGRVMSVFSILLAGSTPIGAMLTGGVMDLWGPRAGFLVSGTLGVILTAAIGTWSRRMRGRAAPAAAAGEAGLE